jgi:hypothetical protein
MTDTLLVRLKPYDPRRGHVLRRYTYAGIKFQDERGWYRVERPVAEYLRAVREVPSDRYAPLAFDVCTEAEAKALDAGEQEVAKVKKSYRRFRRWLFMRETWNSTRILSTESEVETSER